MMKAQNIKPKLSSKSWVERKLANPKFREGFEEEVEKLSIGERLLKLRLSAGLTQAEVAKRVGTTASAISRYENAEYDRYEIKTLRKIVEACGGKLQIRVEPQNTEEAA
jgi:ribosome-binding protein aMBF1 (putative translation factor)